MRRIFSVVFAFALLLTGCGAPAQLERPVDGKPSTEEAASEPGTGLFLEMEHEVYDPSMEHFTYFLRNGTGETVEFGEDYAIQRWENGQWQDLTMKSNAGFNAIGYALQPGGSMALTSFLSTSQAWRGWLDRKNCLGLPWWLSR